MGWPGPWTFDVVLYPDTGGHQESLCVRMTEQRGCPWLGVIAPPTPAEVKQHTKRWGNQVAGLRGSWERCQEAPPKSRLR